MNMEVEYINPDEREEKILNYLKYLFSLLQKDKSITSKKIILIIGYDTKEQDIFGSNIKSQTDDFNIILINPKIIRIAEGRLINGSGYIEPIDTFLHELAHFKYFEHNSSFYQYWDELRNKYTNLVLNKKIPSFSKKFFITGKGIQIPNKFKYNQIKIYNDKIKGGCKI